MAVDTRLFGELFAGPPRNGLTRPMSVRGAGTKMVNMGELFAHPRLRDAAMDRVPLGDPEAERFLLRPGDLLFARQSLVLEGAGKCSIFLGDDEPVTFESHVTRVRLNPRQAEPLFYFYYLLSPHGRAAIRSIVEQGAGASGIRGSDLSTLRVRWRPLPEQHEIARILGALDDKIELNRRTNETLEAIARPLFKSWFVDFDPVRAKSEERDPGLPPHIADLFPDSFVDSELGEVPQGWEVQPFSATIEIIGGGTPKTSVAEYWNGDIPWFSVVDAPTRSDVWVVNTEKKITGEGVEKSSTRVLPVGTTIISARGTVGRVALVGVPMAMNQSCYGVLGKAGAHGFFTYFAARELVGSLQQHAHGSVFDTITRDTLAGVSVALPSTALIEAFEDTVRATLERLRSALIESSTVTTLRDTLLPKLISGELRVADARRVAGARLL